MWLPSGVVFTPRGPRSVWATATRSIDWARALRTFTSLRASLVPFNVMWLKFGADERCSVVPLICSARRSRFTSEPMPMKSISPLARASGWASRSIWRKMISSSLARLPQKPSLRTSRMVLPVASTCAILNGPAVARAFSFQPSLKTLGSLLVDAGYSGLNNPCQSTNGEP
jgi:hypothetical protein